MFSIRNHCETFLVFIKSFRRLKSSLDPYFIEQSKMTVNNPQKNRITELDFFRGIALILMIYFHIIWSMHEIYGYQVFYSDWINFYIGKISAILFILISGIVFSLVKFKWKRFFLLAGIAIGISGVSYLYGNAYGINFGIIHFFAVSSLLAILFSKVNKYILIAIWIGIIAMWGRIHSISTPSDYLFFLWLVNKTFHSADYYPLIPRFGIYLIGMGISKIFYTEKRNIFWKTFNIKPINFVGRNTLLIYIIHQPIIIWIFYLVQFIRP